AARRGPAGPPTEEATDDVGERAPAEEGPADAPDRDADGEGLHRQVPLTLGGPNSRCPGGRPSAAVASGLIPRVILSGGAAVSQSKVASSAILGPHSRNTSPALWCIQGDPNSCARATAQGPWGLTSARPG